MYLAPEPMLRKKRGVNHRRRSFACVNRPGVSPNAM
ncbi:hypothetical protein RB2603 [Rhodopirellula baltica SH 1]|uniref:Uncharacterized protein n=1 Tax=Rhodopirellula baltica (strain DSM 10527 / NCIMB 13988 / SH1) TaxID=243090 RepID=Q7UVJ0_RHOBA|nr:hypothetical protein RB2603 [Rhodopirellula baltica SH 1]